MRFCHECAAQVAPTDVYCAYCGAALKAVSDFQKSVEANRAVQNPSKNLDLQPSYSETTIENQIDPASQKPPQFNVKAVDDPQTSNRVNDQLHEPEILFNQPIKITAKASDLQPLEPENRLYLPTAGDPFAASSAENAPEHRNPNEISREVLNESATLIKQMPAFNPPNDAVATNSNEVIASAKIEIDEVDKSAINEPAASNFGTLAAEPENIGGTNREVWDSAEPSSVEVVKAPETPGGKSPALKPLDDGTLLNRRYEIVRRIGGGGMGAVYLAKDQNLGGTLRAVKEMIQAYVDGSQQEKAVQDFRRESILLSQLEHTGIPTIYDYFYDEAAGRFYLVMKYIAGGDLATKLRHAPDGRLNEASVTEWAMNIADVLDYLHNQEPVIVYRDLKPSNIMLDQNGRAMLIDFGIARWVNKEEKGVTAVGTMGYAPPELFAGNAEPRSDIYSLGATMFHLLTGADPQSNPLLIFDFTKNPRPRQINLGLSVEIEDILMRAVEYKTDLRFESAAKMREALQQHLDKLRYGKLTFERYYPVSVSPQPQVRQPVVPAAQQTLPKMVFCGFCGEKIVASDAFCAYCGAPQTAANKSAPVNSTQLAQIEPGHVLPINNGATTARLVVLNTKRLDAPIFTLEKETNLIGREDRRSNIFPEIDLTRYDTEKAKISRRHARIWQSGGGFMVEDLNSANGTLLILENDQAVRLQPHQPHILSDGDRLKLGETTLCFYSN